MFSEDLSRVISSLCDANTKKSGLDCSDGCWVCLVCWFVGFVGLCFLGLFVFLFLLREIEGVDDWLRSDGSFVWICDWLGCEYTELELGESSCIKFRRLVVSFVEFTDVTGNNTFGRFVLESSSWGKGLKFTCLVFGTEVDLRRVLL